MATEKNYSATTQKQEEDPSVTDIPASHMMNPKQQRNKKTTATRSSTNRMECANVALNAFQSLEETAVDINQGYSATAVAPSPPYNVDASVVAASHHPQHLQPQMHPTNLKRLFVAGPTVNQCPDDLLLAVFSSFGKVERINRIYSRNMEPRQMVYIEYVDAESATKAQMHHSQYPISLKGERIHKIELAKPKTRGDTTSFFNTTYYGRNNSIYPMPTPKVAGIPRRTYMEGYGCCDLSNGNGNNFRPPIQMTNNNSTTSTHLQYYHQELFPSVNPAELSQIPASYRHIPPSHGDMYQTSSYCTPPPSLQTPMMTTEGTSIMQHQHQPQRCLKCNAYEFPPNPSWNPQPQTTVTSSPPYHPSQLLQRSTVHNPYAYSADPIQLMSTTTPSTVTATAAVSADLTSETTPSPVPCYPPELTYYSNDCAACQQYVSKCYCQCAVCQQYYYDYNS